jgi:hypothetical protein
MNALEHDKKIMEEIKHNLISKLQSEFGFCGVAESKEKNFVMLNSGETNLIIKIEIKE